VTPDSGAIFELALASLQKGDDDSEGSLVNHLEPTITRCQCLIILALQQHGIAEFSRAAVLISMASGMAVDLQLHRASASQNAFDIEIRSRLWWNIYMLEQMLCGEMGRPVFLRSEEADVPLPSVTESDEFEIASVAIRGESSRRLIRSHIVSAFHTTIGLGFILEQISRHIYGLAGRQAIEADRQSGERLRMELWGRLKDWKTSLDKSQLRLDLESDDIAAPVTITNVIVSFQSKHT